ncbi:MAG: hypothetical protein AAF335_01085 [Bacteroidota bacterium]
MIINEPEYLLLEELIEVRNTFEQKEHTPGTVSLLICFLRWYENFFTFEQRKEILYFIHKIVEKSFLFDQEKYDSFNKMTDYFSQKIRLPSKEHEEFVYLTDLGGILLLKHA